MYDKNKEFIDVNAEKFKDKIRAVSKSPEGKRAALRQRAALPLRA